MYLRRLLITQGSQTLREVNFTQGVNLLVTKTPVGVSRAAPTTNNSAWNWVATTLLKLIDYCLGGSEQDVYASWQEPSDSDSVAKLEGEAKQIAEPTSATGKKLQEFLVSNKICVSLEITSDLEAEQAPSFTITRNFLTGREAILTVNGEKVGSRSLDAELRKIFFPNLQSKAPTLRQLLARHLRYQDKFVVSPLQTLPANATAADYENLYLYLLNCGQSNATEKLQLVRSCESHKRILNNLYDNKDRDFYQGLLEFYRDKVAKLEEKKQKVLDNHGYAADLQELNELKYAITRTSAIISNLDLKVKFLQEAIAELQTDVDVDVKQLEVIYKETTQNFSGLLNTFEKVKNLHNSMRQDRIKFMTVSLNDYGQQLNEQQQKLAEMLTRETELSDLVAKLGVLEDLDELNQVIARNVAYIDNLESRIQDIDVTNNTITELTEKIAELNKDARALEERLKHKVASFNTHFQRLAQIVFGESLCLSYYLSQDTQLYNFEISNIIPASSGRKQAEMLCFDIAYLLFAQQEHIPCVNFVLSDRKELMHDNQLSYLAEHISGSNMQLLISILEDKARQALLNKANIVVELSQEDKLLRF